jgi:thiol-disulfide isomerase/thioredoxin
MFVLGAGGGFVGCYLLVAEYIVKDQLYADEAQRCMTTLWKLKSEGIVVETSDLDGRLLELLDYMKRPLLGGRDNTVDVDSLSPTRLAAFQFAREYYEHFGWPNDTGPYLADVRAYLEKVPWSAERQALNEWNARFKGPVPQPAPALSSVEWVSQPLPPDTSRGKVTLLAFWGMRCPHCIVAFPRLQELQDKYAGEGLQVVAIHVQRDVERKEVLESLKRKGFSMPVGFGGDELRKSYMVRSLPTYFLLDRQGRLTHGPEHKIPSEEQIRQRLGAAA